MQVQQRLPPSLDKPQDDPLLQAVLSLCPRLEPELAHLLEQLCHSGREVKQLLATDPGPELMVVLDVLEPPPLPVKMTPLHPDHFHHQGA